MRRSAPRGPARRGRRALASLWQAMVLVAAAQIAMAQAADPMSFRAFTEAYADAIQTQVPGAVLTIRDDNAIEVEIDGQVLSVFPDNAYLAYRDDPADIDAIVRRYVQTVEDHAQKLSLNQRDNRFDPDRLLHCVRALDYGSSTEGAAKAMAPLVGDLATFVCEDTPNATNFVDAAGYAALASKIADLDQRVVRNTEPLVQPVDFEVIGNMVSVTSGNGYTSSLILIDGIWEALAKHLGPELVFAVPTRDVFLVASGRDDAAVASLRRAAAQSSDQAPYRISDRLYRWQAGTMSVFDP